MEVVEEEGSIDEHRGAVAKWHAVRDVCPDKQARQQGERREHWEGGSADERHKAAAKWRAMSILTSRRSSNQRGANTMEVSCGKKDKE
jgi:hypothetical protein